MRTAIYLRQSLDRSGEGAAVERQETDCRLLAQAKRWDVSQVFTDNDISASSGKHRPGFEAMLEAVTRGQLDAVIVWHLDRMVRRMTDLMRVVEAGQKYRLNISSVHGVSIDLGDPTGVAVAQILTAIAGMEAGHKAVRQMAAARQRASAGTHWWSRRPFGYNLDGTVNVIEAVAVRQAYADVLAGASLSGIARRWNQANLLTPVGNPWEHRAVGLTLIKPRNAALRTYHGEIVGPAVWEPIIDEATWRIAEGILRAPARYTGGQGRRMYLLTGVGLCGVCGATLRGGVNASAMRIYKCSKHSHLSRNLNWVNRIVRAAVLARLNEPDVQAIMESDEPDFAPLRTKRDTIRRGLVELATAFAQRKISITQLTSATEQMEAELAVLETKMVHPDRAPLLGPLVSAEDHEAAWDALDIDRQRSVIGIFWTIVLMPTPKNTFKGAERNPSEVQFRPALVAETLEPPSH